MEILLLRPEQITRKVLNILNSLSDTSKLTLSEAKRIVELQIHNNHYTYVGYVGGKPVAIGSFVVLSKLIHNGGRSALIEDVAVEKSHQGMGYGKEMVKLLRQKAKTYNVYKIFLNCKEELESYYCKAGFYYSGLCMREDC